MTTLVTGGTVVSATGSGPADVLIDGDTIAAVLSPGSAVLGPANADTVIDAAGKYVIPGVTDGRISLERWVDVCCTTPARMFGMYGKKGVISPGADADIVVYDPNGHTSIGVGKTHHMNIDYSAWEGWEIDGHVDVVLSRGTVVKDESGYVG